MKLRNAIGADKKNLVIQLLLELTLLVGISFLLASCLLELPLAVSHTSSKRHYNENYYLAIFVS